MSGISFKSNCVPTPSKVMCFSRITSIHYSAFHNVTICCVGRFCADRVPVFVTVSQATLASGSWRRWASSTASEIWSHILSRKKFMNMAGKEILHNQWGMKLCWETQKGPPHQHPHFKEKHVLIFFVDWKFTFVNRKQMLQSFLFHVSQYGSNSYSICFRVRFHVSWEIYTSTAQKLDAKTDQ
jgi:hypothetical protein